MADERFLAELRRIKEEAQKPKRPSKSWLDVESEKDEEARIYFEQRGGSDFDRTLGVKEILTLVNIEVFGGAGQVHYGSESFSNVKIPQKAGGYYRGLGHSGEYVSEYTTHAYGSGYFSGWTLAVPTGQKFYVGTYQESELNKSEEHYYYGAVSGNRIFRDIPLGTTTGLLVLESPSKYDIKNNEDDKNRFRAIALPLVQQRLREFVAEVVR